MKTISFHHVTLLDGYLKSKERLNEEVTLNAVYDRFYETGRIRAFECSYKEGDEQKPHFFWDSDVAKWIEGAAYTLKKKPSPALEKKIDAIVENIRKNQGSDGYFNIYFTVCEPDKRFSNRDWHELYCAGHLMEAAIAYADATGKTLFLTCMEKYADYIEKVFLIDQSAAFKTPGHEEIELALVRLFRYTGKKKYLDMAAYFINQRGISKEDDKLENFQSHLPVREQTEALGHAVRALYLYTGMAYLAKETNDTTLTDACRILWEDIDRHKMYITGGVGSTYIGEAFTRAYDLPNDTAYSETCASIAMMLFGNAMLSLENDARYADTVERALYNGVLSGLSLSGDAFFYTNPLEINLSERFHNYLGKRKLPITQRVACFGCSCCPPNLNRLLSSLGNYIYGVEDGILYVNQYTASNMEADGITATQTTEYPNNGTVRLTVNGASHVALRIPGWCDSFTLNHPYTMKNGYAILENPGTEILLAMDMPVRAVFAHPKVLRDAGRIALMRGPIVYCAESVDNVEDLHSITLSPNLVAKETYDASIGLCRLEVPAKVTVLPEKDTLYSYEPPKEKDLILHLLPYSAFANRGETNMTVWFRKG